MNNKKKIALGLGIKAKKLIDGADDIFKQFEDYLVELTPEEQLIFVYVYICKVLSGFDAIDRKELIDKISKIEEFNWNIMGERDD